MLFNAGPQPGLSSTHSGNSYVQSYGATQASSSAAHQTQFKSFQQAALMSSMLQASNPTPQSELLSQLSYHHGGGSHHHHAENAMNGPTTISRGPSPSTGRGGGEYTTAVNQHEHSPCQQSDLSPGSTTGASSTHGHAASQNEVRTVMLYSVPIVSLVMDGQERLCLAQISNTLLKNFSYNEIHNRRVALGITCVQCTPVQLELLRRAGAMPVSSRRCGMITKREAERLCKSFLAETAPPKLPENFAFEVYHSCAWGCQGQFTPSRYNSSRAKCIKCIYCGLFFSPNKFIFHSHRLPTSKYVQPDAANFNSWRRHIKLVESPDLAEHVIYAWEDVKAMFNGGSRKRAMTTTLNSFTKNQENHKMHGSNEDNEVKPGRGRPVNRYKYCDDNSGLDDSDEYCSLDGGPSTGVGAVNSTINSIGTDNELSESSSQENSAANQHQSSGGGKSDLTNLVSSSYQSFGHHQTNSKGLLENHLKKAFEVNSLIEGGPTKEQEPPTIKLPLMTSNTGSLCKPFSTSQDMNDNRSKSSELISGTTFESYFESTRNSSLTKPTLGQSATPPYLSTSHPSTNDQLVSGYGFFSSPGIGLPPRHHLADTRLAVAHTHPAILSSLLNVGIPESTSQHLRSSLLPPGYVQLSPSLGHPLPVNTSTSESVSLLNPTVAPPSADFRNNLAEFMWSMASKTSPANPYSLLWSQTHGQLGAGHSSSPSSTSSSLSPNQSVIGNCNAEEIRKALLLNSNLLQQHHQHQQRNTVAPFGMINGNPNMPFLPNLIGPNLKLMQTGGTPSAALASNYLLAKEQSGQETDSVTQGTASMKPHASKSPTETAPPSLSNMPLFPFRCPFTAHASTASLDRFSSEMLAARQQFLIDAYQNAASNGSGSNQFPPNSRSLFPSHMLEQSKHFGEHVDNLREGAKSIDVIVDEDESNEMDAMSSLKSIGSFHQFGHSQLKNQFSAKGNNGDGVCANQRNSSAHKRVEKRTLDSRLSDNNRLCKKLAVVNHKTKSCKRKITDSTEVDSYESCNSQRDTTNTHIGDEGLTQQLEPQPQRLGKEKTIEGDQCNVKKGENHHATVAHKQSSTTQPTVHELHVNSQNTEYNSFGDGGGGVASNQSCPPSLPVNGKLYMLVNNGHEETSTIGQGATSTVATNQSIKLVT